MPRHSLFILLGLLPALPAAAGVIRGTLEVPPVPPAQAAVDHYPGRVSSLPDARPAPHGLVSDAVVYFESIPPDVDAALAHAARVPELAQWHQSFVPRVLPVAVGTTVQFPNRDPIYHNVFSVSPVKRFDLGKYPRGHSKPVTFTKTGLVHVFCDIHADMEAFVLVLPHHGFTQPDAAGAFRLPEVPAGDYILHVWHPDFGERTRAVRIEAGETVVALRY